MNGENYRIFMASSAHKKYKKFHSDLKEKIKDEIQKLAESPYKCEELKGHLKGIRSYHFEYNKTQYRIAYRILEAKKEIEVVLIKTREGFYEVLRRIILV